MGKTKKNLTPESKIILAALIGAIAWLSYSMLSLLTEPRLPEPSGSHPPPKPFVPPPVAKPEVPPTPPAVAPNALPPLLAPPPLPPR